MDERILFFELHSKSTDRERESASGGQDSDGEEDTESDPAYEGESDSEQHDVTDSGNQNESCWVPELPPSEIQSLDFVIDRIFSVIV